MRRIIGALAWSLYVWRFEGRNLMHYSISLMLSWFVWSCFLKRVHLDYPRMDMAHFPANQKWTHQLFSIFPTSAYTHGPSFCYVLRDIWFLLQSFNACLLINFRIPPSMNHFQRPCVFIFLFSHLCFQILIFKNLVFK